MPTVLSVKQLNLYVKTLLEGDARLSYLTVTGELSNFKYHTSGHLYFSLKDNDALIRCVMFRGNTFSLNSSLKDGDKVICHGRVSLFERDGTYQLYVEKIVPVGLGEVAEKFRLVKERLAKEGLFSNERKRPLPQFPKKIAVVTSQTGAALQDVLNIISRRYPLCRIIICPVLVQGEQAPSSIIEALSRVYKTDVDLIIVGRGGGSAEDLSAFNDENLARFLVQSPIPTISAVGHETDFTICDFVADFRAPTPSAAAEIAVPDINELKQRVDMMASRIKNSYEHNISKKEIRYLSFAQREYFQTPILLFAKQEQKLQKLYDSLIQSTNMIVSKKQETLSLLACALDNSSPLKILSRGYTSVSANGKLVTGVKNIKQNDKLVLNFRDGKAECTVDKITEDK